VARARTITLYVDKAAFRQALELPHEEDIYVLLVDREGNVLWRAEGAFTPEKGESLAAVLRGER
jgi:predicted transcriptional regulator